MDRLISKQAVLNLIADFDLSLGQVIKGIHALPSVKPQEPNEDMTIAYLMGLYADKKPCEDAISRQSLLELMGEEPFNWTDSDKEVQAVEDYRNFKNMVEQLPSVKPQYTDDEIQKMQDLEQAEIQKAYELGKAEAQKWIPVSERLPEGRMACLVYGKMYFIPDHVNQKNWFYDYSIGRFNPAFGWSIRGDMEILAWMPLPPCYEPQESEGKE